MAEENQNDNISVQPKEIDINGKTLKELQEMAKYLIRGKERGLINESTGSSITLRNSGQINLSSSTYSQYKLNPNGINTEYSIESNLVTNRRNIKTDEIIINDHKLNSDLYEFTDMKEVKLSTCSEPFIVGNFTIYGSVLVKAWEPDLKRYMLIRRPCRMPMFSPKLNLPEIHTALNINDPLNVTESILAYSPDKGYQVNNAQTDDKTYIRDADGDGFVDAGEDRAGINRNNMNVIGASVTSGGGESIGGGSSSKAYGPAPGKGKENIPKSASASTIELANSISTKTGLPVDWIWAQLYHETGNFQSRLATEDHNYAGIICTNPSTQKVAGKQPDGAGYYRHFDTDEEYAIYAASNLKAYEEDGIMNAKNMLQFAQALQHGGYFGAGLDEYYGGLCGALGNKGTEL